MRIYSSSVLMTDGCFRSGCFWCCWTLQICNEPPDPTNIEETSPRVNELLHQRRKHWENKHQDTELSPPEAEGRELEEWQEQESNWRRRFFELTQSWGRKYMCLNRRHEGTFLVSGYTLHGIFQGHDVI